MFISEIFMSIQGESTFSGLPCVFVRLAGCNLRCTWCDTSYAQVQDAGEYMAIDEIMNKIAGFGCKLVEITGGEPLMQDDAKILAKRLLDSGHTVLIETNGSVSLKGLDQRAIKIVDVKCPSSGFGGSFLLDNLQYMTGQDEVKFVIGNMEDYEFAKWFISEHIKDRTTKKLFAPVKPELDPKELAQWILKDRLSVRFQIQLHAYVWDGEKGR